MPSSGKSDIAVSLAPIPARDELAASWQDLEGRAAASVFLSWTWIGALIPFLAPGSLLVRARQRERLVGLAVLGRQPGGRSATLHLNETGVSPFDRIEVEYNGILAERGHEAEVTAAVLAALAVNSERGRQRLFLSGVSIEWIEACRGAGFDIRQVRRPQVAPFVRLSSLTPEDPLESLSRNTRQQARRSLRFYGRRGTLTLSRAASVEQALEWFAALETFHVHTWEGRGKPGAFANPGFRPFHQDLIARGFDEGVPELLCAKAGDSVIGYLYNLRWQNLAYSYQSGFHYEEEADSRPGLVSHLLAMRRYRAEGVVAYRLLAGGTRFKRSLAKDEDTLYWMIATRSGLFGRLGHLARHAADLIRGSRLGTRLK